MIIIEINERDSRVHERSAQTRNGAQIFYHQDAYLHRPGQAYPDRFRLPLKGPQGYPAGQYHLTPDSYRVGKYGDLEINRFEIALDPIQRPAAVQKSA